MTFVELSKSRGSAAVRASSIRDTQRSERMAVIASRRPCPKRARVIHSFRPHRLSITPLLPHTRVRVRRGAQKSNELLSLHLESRPGRTVTATR